MLDFSSVSDEVERVEHTETDELTRVGVTFKDGN